MAGKEDAPPVGPEYEQPGLFPTGGLYVTKDQYRQQQMIGGALLPQSMVAAPSETSVAPEALEPEESSPRPSKVDRDPEHPWTSFP